MLNSSFFTNVWNESRQQIFACVLIWLMILGLLFSRAILSISIILFTVNALHPASIKQLKLGIQQNKWIQCLLLFMLCCIFSGLWSEDVSTWAANLSLKLPLILLPISFFAFRIQNISTLKLCVTGVFLSILSGIIYSLYYFYLSPIKYYPGMHPPTPMESDYLRFSYLIIAGIIIGIMLLWEGKFSKLFKLFLWSHLIIFFAYLHFLAAKSGILFSYAVLFIIVAIKLLQRSPKWVIPSLAVIALIGVVAVFKVRMLQDQYKMLKNDIVQYYEDKSRSLYVEAYRGSFSARMASYEVGFDVIKKHPWLGVGTGDVVTEINKSYDALYPDLIERYKFTPHNQFLISFLALGIPMGMLAVIIAFLPFFLKDIRLKAYWWAISGLSLLFFIIEAMFETQFGVTVYALFMSLFYQLVKTNKEKHYFNTTEDSPIRNPL